VATQGQSGGHLGQVSARLRLVHGSSVDHFSTRVTPIAPAGA